MRTIDETIKLVKEYEQLVSKQQNLLRIIDEDNKQLERFIGTRNNWIFIKYGDEFKIFSKNYVVSDKLKGAIVEDFARYINQEKSALNELDKEIERVKKLIEEK